MIGSRAAVLAALVVALPALALDPATETPRSGVIEVKIGGYRPLIDREPGLTGTPYADTFGNKAWIIAELEYDQMLFQSFGSAGFGLGIGYAEKFAPATLTGGGGTAAESTSIKILPIRALAVYRFDYGALKYGIPFTPFVKAGLVYTPYWSSSGVAGEDASGGQWGYAFAAGVGFMLDFLDARLQRDFDSEMGVNHTYAFAEFTFEDVNDFHTGFDLSSRRFSVGLAFDF